VIAMLGLEERSRKICNRAFAGSSRRVERPWVKLGGAFVQPMRDYTFSDAKGRRGVFLWWALHEGEVYEVFEGRGASYLVRAEQGEIVRVDASE